MTAIEVVFVGLIMFVPKVDAAGLEVCMVLVDARAPLVVQGEIVPAHYPAIRVRADRVVDGYRTPDLVLDVDGVDFAYFFLDDEQLTFEPRDPDEDRLTMFTLKEREKPYINRPCCDDESLVMCRGLPTCFSHPYAAPFEDQTRDVSWVMPMDTIVPQARHIAGDCFEQGAPPSTVVARAKLAAGELSSYLLEGEGSASNKIADRVELAYFPPQGGLPDFVSAAARAVIHTMRVRDAGSREIVISSQRFLTGVPDPKPIVLVTFDDVLQLMIVNLPEDELLKPMARSPQEHPALHFAHYYRLSEQPIPESLWRIPECPDCAGDLLCPPAQGEP